MGQKLEDLDEITPPWDSNAITPGTPFMHLLATSLRYWVALKINTDPGWHGVSYHLRYHALPTKIAYRCKSSSPMLQFLVKANIKLWITFDANVLIPDTTQTRNM